MTDKKKYSRIRAELFAGLMPALVLACSLGLRRPVQEVPVVGGVPETSQDDPAQQADTGSEQAPQIALTFDDGPHSVYTPRLLDGLKERGIPATFFVLGENIEGNEELLERMNQEGHLIGNHTYHHVKLDSLQHDTAVEEIQKTSMLVEKITGQGTEFIRPPFGIWNKTLEYDVTMLPALWNIDTRDWTTKNVPVTVEKVMDGAADQGIILFHDCYASSVEAALRAVDLLLEQGYEFVTVDQIILPP